MRSFKRIFRSHKGFTFLEVLTVMLVIGILASTMIPNLIKTRTEKLLADRTVKDIQARIDAIKWYRFRYGVFPSNWNDLRNTGLLPSGVADTGPLGNYGMTIISADRCDITVPYSPSSNTARYVQQQLSSSYTSGGLLYIPVYRPGIEVSLTALRNDMTNYTNTQVGILRNDVKSAISSLRINDFRYAGLVNSNTTVNKPTCPTGMSPYIYVVPVIEAAAGKPIIGVTAYAQDLGNSWIVKGGVKGADGIVYSDSANLKLLAFVTCF